jgi:hypothetical protein
MCLGMRTTINQKGVKGSIAGSWKHCYQGSPRLPQDLRSHFYFLCCYHHGSLRPPSLAIDPAAIWIPSAPRSRHHCGQQDKCS